MVYEVQRRFIGMVVVAGFVFVAGCASGPGGGQVDPGQDENVVTSTTPIDGATAVNPVTAIVIRFGSAVVTSSLDLVIEPETANTQAWSSGNTVLTISPDGDGWPESTTITVRLNGVTFANGQELDAAEEIAFTTSEAVSPVEGKWALWASGQTRLRGANIHPCKVFQGEESGCMEDLTLADIEDLRDLGANLLNASYPGILEEDAPYGVNEENRQYMDDLVSWAEQAGMYVVIHLRTGPGRNASAVTDPTGSVNNDVWYDTDARAAWIDMWRQIAERYGDSEAVVGYNLLTEPNINYFLGQDLSPADYLARYSGTQQDWNLFASEITQAIREMDTETPIIVGSLQWCSAEWFEALVPTGDARTVYSFHHYDPDVYTNQEDASISYPSVVQDGGESITFDRSWLEGNLAPVVDFVDQYSVPVYVGEFGVFRWASGADEYLSDLIGLFEANGWGWAYYIWRGNEPGFNGFDMELGTNQNNTTPSEDNELMSVFTGAWSSNVDRPAPGE